MELRITPVQLHHSLTVWTSPSAHDNMLRLGALLDTHRAPHCKVLNPPMKFQAYVCILKMGCVTRCYKQLRGETSPHHECHGTASAMRSLFRRKSLNWPSDPVSSGCTATRTAVFRRASRCVKLQVLIWKMQVFNTQSADKLLQDSEDFTQTIPDTTCLCIGI